MTMPSVFVTGASRGIGAAIVKSLASAGFYVGCASRTGKLPSDDPEISAPWQSLCEPITADVTDADSVRSAVEAFVQRSGSLNGVVNCAGIHEEGAAAEITDEQWSRVMSTNAASVLWTCQAAYPHLVAAGGGLIVSIGSFFDKLGVKRNLAYCASKAAVGAMTRVLAVEWAGAGIRALNVAPGYVLTDLNREAMTADSLRKFLQARIPRRSPAIPAEIGAFVAALFGAGGAFLTGETIYIDGGQGIAL
jgi:NAD(P)-dependent dehydrogenase (short-subunit alcohol dehydrogenase family)